MRRLNLIMPMGGGGTRFADKGFELPKPLIEIHGRPFFYWAVKSITQITPPHAQVKLDARTVAITFVVLKKHVDEHRIDEAIHKFFPEAKIKIIPEVLPGAVCTCLKGVEDIDEDCPVIFNDCDHMFACKTLHEKIFFQERLDFDGALLTFESRDPHFSYVRFDQSGNIVGTVEKQVVSNRAICGAYLFANAALFRQMSERYFEHCQYKEYFISGVYNELCNAGKRVLDFQTDFHVSFGTPSEYEDAKSSMHFDEIGSL